ncbi:dynamin family protein [Ruania alba]|uniref:Dynamin family protein n=1 Tax=Ruania alba TaxID=648782 RepID=A0A1H5FQX3_9MICO|nr:dynamin family protein [Ruania alba]SEE05809.1 Dynamin family protein [Ruania alba]
MDDALQDLRTAIAGAQLPLETSDAPIARRHRGQLTAQLEDYVIPRAASLEAPLLAVVGGSTGAGKSTLVNALVGERVARTSALRPTTRDPLLIHHPSDADWFVQPRVLPHLARVQGKSVPDDGGGVVRLVATNQVGPGLALLDAPDIDSVVDANRELAGQLLAAADLWVFVTTAHRYADAVPWDLLRDAARRDVVVAVVLDRIPPPVLHDVSTDLEAMLSAEGLGEAPLFLLTETDLGPDAMLPEGAVDELAEWLDTLTEDASSRAQVARQTLHGAVRDVADGAQHLADAVLAQQRLARDLHRRVATAYDTTDLLTTLADGAMLRGEVLSRWQDFVGTGEFFRSVETTVGRVRDRVTAFLTGRPQPAREVKEAIGHGLHAVLVDQADTAAERAFRAFATEPAARGLLPGHTLEAAAPEFSEHAAEQIRAWQRYLLELVQNEGQDKRTTARIMAFGVNGVAVVLMVVAFASTGGLVGAEVAIAGGTAVVAQKLLEAIFGDQAVRRLAERAREDLHDRVRTLMAQDQQRFTQLLPDPDQAETSAVVLRDAATAAVAAVEAAGR